MISHLARSPLAHRRTHSTPSGCSLEDVAAGPGLAGGATSPLADVPENEEVRCPRRLASSHALANTPTENCTSASLFSPPLLLVTGVRGNLPKNRDWIRLQQTIRSLFKTRRVALQPGELAALHERIRALSGSKAGPFIYDSYKRELEVCFTALRHKLCQQPRDQLLAALADEWDNLFTHVLPTLDLILYVVKGKGSESIRQTFLGNLQRRRGHQVGSR
uniref:Uncharacterized protein n=1 Tax=Ixodes ricinus TaxID=34613 RepID=V5I0W7_IXORI